MTAPQLKHGEGSWVVTHIESGEKREFFKGSRAKVDWFSDHPDTFLVETIGDYLGRVNAEIRSRS